MAGEVLKWFSILENCLAVPQNIKHRVTMRPINSTPKYISERNEKICPHKQLHTNVHSTIIIGNQNQTTQMSIK